MAIGPSFLRESLELRGELHTLPQWALMMRGAVRPSLGAAKGLLRGHLHHKTHAVCLTEGSPRSGRGYRSCCPLLGFRCSQPRVLQCQDLVSAGSLMLTEIFHQLGERATWAFWI